MSSAGFWSFGKRYSCLQSLEEQLEALEEESRRKRNDVIARNKAEFEHQRQRLEEEWRLQDEKLEREHQLRVQEHEEAIRKMEEMFRESNEEFLKKRAMFRTVPESTHETEPQEIVATAEKNAPGESRVMSSVGGLSSGGSSQRKRNSDDPLDQPHDKHNAAAIQNLTSAKSTQQKAMVGGRFVSVSRCAEIVHCKRPVTSLVSAAASHLPPRDAIAQRHASKQRRWVWCRKRKKESTDTVYGSSGVLDISIPDRRSEKIATATRGESSATEVCERRRARPCFDPNVKPERSPVVTGGSVGTAEMLALMQRVVSRLSSERLTSRMVDSCSSRPTRAAK